MKKFGKYSLVAELGQGGMADVILALAQGPGGFNKLVVIKRLRSHLEDEPEFRTMLVDEARLAARLNHPNIVHTNEVGEIGGLFFMAMEFLEGQPLTRVTRRARREDASQFDRTARLYVILNVLDGLHYAHELADFDGSPLNVVHRDVTPSNVFITYEGVVKVVDFGIAKAAGRSTETKTGVVKGKMTYMSPEQAMGVEVDRRADVYSAGVMLWEACTGQRMWKGVDDVVILGKLIRGDSPVSPKEVDPSIDDELARICLKALDPDLDVRYATAADFQADLEAYLKTLNNIPSEREIGRMVAGLFAEERKELKRIIDSQLAALADSGVLSLDPVVLDDPMSLAPGSMREPSASVAPERNSELPRPTSGPARKPWLAIVAALATVGAGVVWSTAREDTAARAGTSASATLLAVGPGAEVVGTPSNGASAGVNTSTARVELRATPAGATFRIDAGPKLENPYIGELPRDGATHEITIEADGYESLTKTVHAQKDVLIHVTLKKKKARRPRARRVAPPETASPTHLLPPPAAAPTKPKPTLLKGDPWAL